MSETCEQCGGPVVYTEDLGECPMCGEPWCDKCQLHYDNCKCCGPMGCAKDEEE